MPARSANPSPDLDLSHLDHLMGLKTSLADARLRRAFHKGMKPLKLRPVDFTILVLLASNPVVSQKMLCRTLDVSPPGMAVILDRLQARRLLVRERSETDRREHRLALTDAGRKLAAQAERVSHEIEGDVLAVLTAGERLLLGELLQKLVRGQPAVDAEAAVSVEPQPRAAARVRAG